MASALIYTHERYQSNGLSSRESSMKKTAKAQQKGYGLEPLPPEAAAHGSEAVAESDGSRRQRHPLLRKTESAGAPVKMDVETRSDDSRSLKRKSMSLNAEGAKDANSDVAGVEQGVMFPDVASLSKDERRAYRKRLRLDLEKVQGLEKRIEAREQELRRRWSTSDVDNNALRRSASNLNIPRSDNGGFIVKEVINEPAATTPTETPRGVMSQREARLARLPSVTVPEPLSGTPGAPSKEKRTPKANQLYLNSEFVSGKDRMPPPEKLKPKAATSLKRGSTGKLDLKEAKRQRVQNARSKRMADLLKQCGTLLKRLLLHKHAWVFQEPVDVIKLGLHDYFKVIRKPMDLGTIKKNLENGAYDSPVEFAEDVRLVFSNAVTYNPKGHDVHTMAEIMRHAFELRWKSIEEKYEEEKMKIKVEDEALAQGQEQTQQELQDLKQQMQSLENQINHLKGRPPGATRGAASVKPKSEGGARRPMTFEEKQKLSADLENMPGDKLDKIVLIIMKRNPNLGQDANEIEVDIDSFDNETLWELERIVSNSNKSGGKSKKKGAAQKSAVPAAGQVEGEEQPPSQPGTEVSKKVRKGEGGEEEVDIDDDAPSAQFPPVIVDKDAVPSKSSSSDSSDSEGSSSDSDSDSGSSSDSDSDAEEAQSADVVSKASPTNKEPVGSGAVRDHKGSCALETDGAKRDIDETADESRPSKMPPSESQVRDGTSGVPPGKRISPAASDQRPGSGPLSPSGLRPKAPKSVVKHMSADEPSRGCSPPAPATSGSPGVVPMMEMRSSPPVASERHISPEAGRETQESPGVPAERQVSPEKLLRAARMRDRFYDTILKAQEKTFPSSKSDKVDPEKLKRDREELERRQREEKARLAAEAKAAEMARKKKEAEALAEQIRRREAEREAARVALQKMEKTVEIDENCEILKDLEMMGTTQLEFPSSGEEGSSDGSPEGLPNFGGPGAKPLEQLGLFIRKDEDEEEDRAEDNVEENGDAGDIEEGEID